MTLFDLALKNIQRNIKNYALYIGAIVFSIVIYFTFATLKYDEDIIGIADTSKQVSSLMSVGTFILFIFVAVFIYYSNHFFMTRRKKEIGLYSLLGVRKKSIGLLLFFENMVIGIFSLIIGVALGFLLSRALLALLLKLMGLEVVTHFSFSGQALIHTSIVFLIIFLITSLMGYRVIYAFQLIDLFHAEKQGEKLPKAHILTASFGIISLAAAYYLALVNIIDSAIWQKLGISTPIVIIALTVLGSYLLFNSILVYIFRFLKERQNWSWKDLRLITTSQMLYRIKGNAKTLTIIAVLSATTITAGGAVFGVYYNTQKDVQQYAPYTFMWQGEDQDIAKEKVESKVSFESKTVVVEGETFDKEYALITEEAFDELIKPLGWENTPALNDDEVILIDSFFDDRWDEQLDEIELADHTYSVKEMFTEPIVNIETINGIVVVLPETAYANISEDENVYQAVNVHDYKNEEALSAELREQTESFSSATDNYHQLIEGSGSLLFIGSFLGLVFLVATGSIIFFKTVSEAEADKDKYDILHKIGVSDKQMKKTIRQQVAITFIVPLILGIMHGIVALIATSQLFSMNFFVPVVIWIGAYTLIYIVYYCLPI